MTGPAGRPVLRNPARPWALLGLAAGALVALGCALAGRGGVVASGVLQLLLVAAAATGVLAGLLSLALGARVRRFAGRALGVALSCLLALVVLGTAALVVDTGL